VGSIREYLRYGSMGQYNVQFDVQDWFQISSTEISLSQGQGGRVGLDALQPLFSEALAALDATFTAADWAQYDVGSRAANDGTTSDMVLDHLVVIHSSAGAELGDFANTCGANTQMNRIWSQGGNGVNSPVTVNGGTMDVGGYVLSGAFSDVCVDTPNRMGIPAHEYMHGFGLLDLYDQDYSEGVIEIGGAGNYDIMANTYGWNVELTVPGSLGPVSKMDAAWLDPIEIVANGVYAIQPSETSSQVYVIRSGFPTGEYLLIENRQAIKWDGDWPGSGIVVWHVDLNAPLQTNRGYPGHPNWPAEHYMVSVLQADGLYEIEQGISRGDVGDFWVQGMTLADSDTVWPNTASFQSGTATRTGITIEFLSPSMMVMNFRVSGISGLAPRAPSILSPVDIYEVDDDPALSNDGVLGEVNADLNSRGQMFDEIVDLDTISASDNEADEKYEGPETGSTATWVLSTLGGVGTMLGLLALIL
jgi:immune inhibitor A